MEPDTRSDERKALDEAIAAEPHEPIPPIPPGTPLRPLEHFLPRPPVKLAGFVLALLVFCSHGSTGPFAVVLGLEWLADRRRCPHAVGYDRVSVLLGGLGAAWFLTVSLTLPRHEFYAFLTGPVITYWIVFCGWLVLRMFTRWRDIAASRRGLARLPPRG